VRAAKAVLDMIEILLPPTRGAPVLHWFTGTKAEAKRAVELGAYFSINREMLRGDRRRSMVASLPLERLLTESDGPFVKMEGRDARPSDVAATLDDLARLRSLPVLELADIVAHNLKRLVAA
jgi:TatD DNase family protein